MYARQMEAKWFANQGQLTRVLIQGLPCNSCPVQEPPRPLPSEIRQGLWGVGGPPAPNPYTAWPCCPERALEEGSIHPLCKVEPRLPKAV